MSKKKVVVDFDLCHGHAVCMGEAPEIFKVDDDGTNTVLIAEVDGELLEKAELAERYCPNMAISLE